MLPGWLKDLVGGNQQTYPATGGNVAHTASYAVPYEPWKEPWSVYFCGGCGAELKFETVASQPRFDSNTGAKLPEYTTEYLSCPNRYNGDGLEHFNRGAFKTEYNGEITIHNMPKAYGSMPAVAFSSYGYIPTRQIGSF